MFEKHKGHLKLSLLLHCLAMVKWKLDLVSLFLNVMYCKRSTIVEPFQKRFKDPVYVSVGVL